MGLPMSTSGSTAEAAALGTDEEFILRHGVRGGHGLEVSGSKARARGSSLPFSEWSPIPSSPWQLEWKIRLPGPTQEEA